MTPTDSPSKEGAFDVREPATALRRAFLQTRPIYLAGSAFSLVIGPVLGYWMLSQYGGPVIGTALGSVIGFCLATPVLVVAGTLGRPYPGEVTIGGGTLTWTKTNGCLAKYDFSRGGSRLKVVLFDTSSKLPPSSSVRMAGPVPWSPFLQGGPARYTPLSQAAAEALIRDLVNHGWRRYDRPSLLGDFGILSVTLRRGRRVGPTPGSSLGQTRIY